MWDLQSDGRCFRTIMYRIQIHCKARSCQKNPARLRLFIHCGVARNSWERKTVKPDFLPDLATDRSLTRVIPAGSCFLKAHGLACTPRATTAQTSALWPRTRQQFGHTQSMTIASPEIYAGGSKYADSRPVGSETKYETLAVSAF
jgi:hypothetical protein